ncbi:hypothetical protein [Haloarcula sebkhae]|uniref:Uncharacterized protein n=1 Tax=Haloarcula sebkhae TaxID=932660 RepID=A0ACC6VNT5_9EURY|nr:hypothetical protein [Haloarcula sebkhae]
MESPYGSFLHVDHSAVANVLGVELDALMRALSMDSAPDQSSRIKMFLDGEFPLVMVMRKNGAIPVNGRRLSSLPRKTEMPVQLEFCGENPYKPPRSKNGSTFSAHSKSGSTVIGSSRSGSKNDLIDGPM